MKHTNPSELAIDELVQLFARIGVAQDVALLGGKITEFNRLFDQMAAVSDELKRRDGDQRRELMALYSYPNMQVRLQAAKLTLAIAPTEARAQLQAIVDSKWFPQAGDAGMTLHHIQTGFYKPT